MSLDIIIGVSLLGIILFLLTLFTLITRNRINKIAQSGPDTARKINKDLSK